MTANITDRFVDELYNLSRGEFRESVLHQAKRCLLDYLGVTFAGAEMLQEKGNSLLDYLGGTPGGDVAVLGFDRRASVENAAIVNGMSAHIAELDDGVRFGMLHPGSPILSALLPIAEKERVAGTDVLTGIIVGYEAAVRIACAIQPSHYNLGYHPTSTCGAIGGAVGIATMLRLSQAQMKDAFSAAAVSAAGTLKVLEDGSELKPFNAGRSAHAGLLAASMARAGFHGPDDALSGDTGFLSMMARQYDLSQLAGQHGEPLAIEKVYVKPYAACRHAHPAIEAALQIRLRTDMRAEDIKTVKVITYRGVLGKHDHSEIHGTSSAKMSIPYSVAVALTCGKAGVEEFTTESISNPAVISLTRKVVVCADDEISALVPQKRAAILEITTYDDIRHTERVDFPKGEPENPLSDNELTEKFMSLAVYGRKTDEERQEMLRIVWNLEKGVHELFRLL